MAGRREFALVSQAEPCDTNYFDRSLLTVQQAKQRGRDPCPNYEECMKHKRCCALRYGREVAKYVMKGGTLMGELSEISQKDFIDYLHYDSADRKEFILRKGKTQVMRAIERFARVVLLENPEESVFENCPECGGIKLTATVIDSGRDGVGLLSGSGKTRRRDVAYCPNCEQMPRGSTFKEEIVDFF